MKYHINFRIEIENLERCKIGKFTFGPLLSRRLGWSLGIDVLPKLKTCDYNCVYCEVGKTSLKGYTNINYRCDMPPNFEQDFKWELQNKLVENAYIQSITFGYNGEPTLNKDLGKLVDIAKKVRYDVGLEKVPITLLTNASTCDSSEVQDTLLKFDLIVAKIDAGSQDLFNAVNRPHYSVPPLNYLIKNLQLLKFKLKRDSKLIIQTLLFKVRPGSHLTSNATRENIVELAYSAINKIVPDQVHIYSIAREPAEHDVISVPKLELIELSDLMASLVTPETNVLYFY